MPTTNNIFSLKYAVNNCDAIAVCEESFQSDDQPIHVAGGIFIGSFKAERNIEACQRSGITHILQVGVYRSCVRAAGEHPSVVWIPCEV